MTTLGLISFFQMLSFAAVLQAVSLPHSGPFLVKGVALTFAENKCALKEIAEKANRKVLFVAQSDNTLYYFRREGISVQESIPQISNHFDLNQVYSIDEIASRQQKLDIIWEGMNKNVDVYGADEISEKFSSTNDKSKSRDCIIKNYRKLYYSELYPGIDLRYYDQDSRLKYDILVKPGFDYTDIKIRFEGAQKLSLDSNGKLLIHTDTGVIKNDVPLVIQNGKPLIAKWIIHANVVGLQIQNYQPDIELFIQSGIGLKSSIDYGM